MLLSALSVRYITYSLQCCDCVGDEVVEGMKTVIDYRVASVYVFEIISILVLYQSAYSMHT